MEESFLGWVDKATGELRIYLSHETLEGYGEVTHDALTDIPHGVLDGTMTWDAASRAFVDDMAVIRDLKWSEVKTKREAVIDGGAVTPLGVMDSDLLSRTNINGAVTGAQIALNAGAPFSEGWRMADNSRVNHTAQQMIDAGMAVLAHVSACHEVAATLYDAIYAADATVADIAAISVENAGWPSNGSA